MELSPSETKHRKLTREGLRKSGKNKRSFRVARSEGAVCTGGQDGELGEDEDDGEAAVASGEVSPIEDKIAHDKITEAVRSKIEPGRIILVSRFFFSDT